MELLGIVKIDSDKFESSLHGELLSINIDQDYCTKEGINGRVWPDAMKVVLAENRSAAVSTEEFIHLILHKAGFVTEAGNEQLVRAISNGLCEIARNIRYA